MYVRNSKTSKTSKFGLSADMVQVRSGGRCSESKINRCDEGENYNLYKVFISLAEKLNNNRRTIRSCFGICFITVTAALERKRIWRNTDRIHSARV